MIGQDIIDRFTALLGPKGVVTDADDIEVIVEGRLGRDGTFHATEVLAKCGSRYEAEEEEARKQA